MNRSSRGHEPSPRAVVVRECNKMKASRWRQALIELMQKLNHGRIEGLVIREGEPVLDPFPCHQSTVKFCSENSPRPEIAITDFVLKAQVVELFEYFDRLENGVIDVLEIKHGLPFCMTVTGAAA